MTFSSQHVTIKKTLQQLALERNWNWNNQKKTGLLLKNNLKNRKGESTFRETSDENEEEFNKKKKKKKSFTRLITLPPDEAKTA